MANGTSASHGRLTIAEVLESPGQHEAYLAEVAVWARDVLGVAGSAHGPETITAETVLAPARRRVTGALLDEAGWFARRLTAAAPADRSRATHLLVFTGLGQQAAVLAEVRSELAPGLLRRGVMVEESHHAGLLASVRNRGGAAEPCPWPCYVLRAG